MEQLPEENTDGSSIRPVSSLRSHFENMLSVNTPTTPRQPSPTRADSRISLDIPREPARLPSPSYDSGSQTPAARTSRPLFPIGSRIKSRPTSMGPLSPPTPPTVAVHSPSSPPKQHEAQFHSPMPSRQVRNSFIEQRGSSRPPSPQGNSRTKISSRVTTPGVDTVQSPYFQPSSSAATTPDPQKQSPPARSHKSTPSIPPPVNRAGKPKVPKKPSWNLETPGRLAPDQTADASEDRISPFSTPPSSETSPHTSPPPVPDASKPRSLPQRLIPSSKDGYFTASSRPNVSERQQVGEPSSFPPRISSIQPTKPGPVATLRDAPGDRPHLPPRRESCDVRSNGRGPPPEPPARRSFDTSRPSALVAENNTKFMPPPKRTSTFGTPGTSSSSLAPPSHTTAPRTPPRASIDVPRGPPPRASIDVPRAPPPRASMELTRHPSAQVTSVQPYQDDSDDPDQPLDKSVPMLTDYPDSSQANRRPPIFKNSVNEIPTKYETKLFAICGEYICTAGYVTRVWNVLTGELLMSISHGDTIKVTSMAFRPAKEVDDEGKRLWLGMNTGEMHEIDIPTQSTVFTKTNAHPRREIIRIYRYASEMWSLDDEGKLHIWPPDEEGLPTLQQTPNSFRLPRGHSFSLVSGSRLWLATGKDIRIFQRTNDGSHFAQLTTKPLSQPNAGEITSGAIISSQPDRIYFGHTDGKVTIYSRKDFSCIAVVSVSLYKISSMVGVGDNLWCGYNTGMVYVYDTSVTPWKVLKDWHAHDNPIAGIAVDRSSIWKLDRLQVASLGTDNMLRLWDGMLKEDWLEAQMQEKDVEYCDFREVTATVMTWNAGACKPTKVQQDEGGARLFRELLNAGDPPDILVFGFQELVDLEDKKVTAKSFFKSSKKKDASQQEHMSHQYRAWRDHLIRMLDEHLPAVPYTLLHTANMVGLFTCIFIKASERPKIRDISAAEVKLGMGGLHGNKGALVVRFILDDSSLCFINCHLAAGQTQTVHRNNDVAAIMEASSLPARGDPHGQRTDLFVGGGDGSMILDHEICILNGDLNYRIDTMGRDTVIAAVRAGNLAKLLERDQLLLSRKRNPGFRLRAFREAPILFAPTYKYDVGTDRYDTSEKRRSPAWCDRLLYRGVGRIKQTEYRRHEVRTSDHRPVSGRFVMRIKTVSQRRRVGVRERLEGEFEVVKRRVGGDIKLDYLVNVFGLSTKEAQRLLGGSSGGGAGGGGGGGNG